MNKPGRSNLLGFLHHQLFPPGSYPKGVLSLISLSDGPLPGSLSRINPFLPKLFYSLCIITAIRILTKTTSALNNGAISPTALVVTRLLKLIYIIPNLFYSLTILRGKIMLPSSFKTIYNIYHTLTR